MKREQVARIISLSFLALAGLFLMALHDRPIGWALLAFGAAALLLTDRKFARDIILVYGSLAVLSLAPLSTDLSLGHIISMGTALLIAVVGPYLVTRYVYKEGTIRYPIPRHTWTRSHLGYLALTAGLAYLILPFWMASTGSYVYWETKLEPFHLTLMFLGVNVVGIWDELFFIVTCLAIFRRHMPFVWANIIQATLFVSFLYELGFRGWAPLFLIPFALLQGYVFKKTENLLYVIAIHLTLDFVLYLALINAHFPEVLDIFITSP